MSLAATRQALINQLTEHRSNRFLSENLVLLHFEREMRQFEHLGLIRRSLMLLFAMDFSTTTDFKERRASKNTTNRLLADIQELAPLIRSSVRRDGSIRTGTNRFH